MAGTKTSRRPSLLYAHVSATTFWSFEGRGSNRWQLLPRANVAMRLPMKRRAASLSTPPGRCRYLSLYIAYRCPHSSISHNSAARWESRGPLHSSVVFHSSTCFSCSQRNRVPIVNIPRGSRRRSACVLRSSRRVSSPTCCVTSA